MKTPPSATRMVSVRYCGRDFTPQDLDGIRAIIASPERPHRTAMAQAVCRLFNWVKPDAGLKVVSCSVALKRMQVAVRDKQKGDYVVSENGTTFGR